MQQEQCGRDDASRSRRRSALKSTKANAKALCDYLVSDFDARWYFCPIVLSRADLADRLGIRPRLLDRAIDWLALNQILLKRERYSRFPIFRLEAHPDAIREFFERSK